MEAPEVPTEHLHEHIHEHAHAAEHSSHRTWTMGVALSSAILAALAAVASLKAGHYANEAMSAQINSANKWSYFQSKSIKESQLNGKMEVITALGKDVSQKDRDKSEEYDKDKTAIKMEAEQLEKESKHFFHQHEIMAKAVTFFQVSIAVAAISVLTRRRLFWFVSMGFGAVGIFFLIQGLLAH
jgi:hypothetical protein